MKALANIDELQSAEFTSFMRELNEFAERYGLQTFTNWSKVWEYPWVCQRLSGKIAEGTRILDIGSELSPIPWRWALQGAQVRIVETNPHHVEKWTELRQRLLDEGHLADADLIQWEIVSNETLPFDDNFFDLVCSFSVVEHMPDKQHAIAELIRVLRPDGMLAISFDICETEMGMTFPEWNGRALTMQEFDSLVWRHPKLIPTNEESTWNTGDIAPFLSWHRKSAEHHNYVVGAAVLRKARRWADVDSILVTRLDGLGDIVLCTGLLAGLHQCWPDARISLLVRPQFATLSSILPDWVRVVPLPFDPRDPVHGRECELAEALKTVATECHSQLCILGEYNRVWAGEILSVLCGAKHVVSFDGPDGLNVHHRHLQKLLDIDMDSTTWMRVPVESYSWEIEKYDRLCRWLTDEPAHQPSVLATPATDEIADTLRKSLDLPANGTVAFFPSSGDLLDKSLDAEMWARWIRHVLDDSDRTVLLLGSESDRDVLDQIAQAGIPTSARRKIISSGDFEMLVGLVKCVDAFIGADTGPTHISAMLGVPTLVVTGGGHMARRFSPVGPRVTVLRMPLECYGCDWFCPFENRVCIRAIPFQVLCDASDRLLRGEVNLHAENPDFINVPWDSQDELSLLRPVMQIHRAWLDLNHRIMETETSASPDAARIGHSLTSINCTLTELTEQNRKRDEALKHISDTLAEMSEQNRNRDEAIAHLDQSRRWSLRVPTRVYRAFHQMWAGLRGTQMAPRQLDSAARLEQSKPE